MLKDLRNILVSNSVKILVSCLLILASGQLIADEYHYKNILVGDRAATMGGAYVAISDDAAGSYYNPAGIAYTVSDSVSGSGNAYHSEKSIYKRALGEADWERNSSSVLPNFLGIIKKDGDSTWAFTNIIPDSGIEHQDQYLEKPNSQINRFFISLHSEDRVSLLGPSYAMKVSDELSFGFSLYYYTREFRRLQRQYLELIDGTTDTYFSSKKLNETGLMPKLGIQWSPMNSVTVGAVLAKKNLSSGSYSIDTTQNKAGEKNTTYDRSSGDQEKKYPTQLSLGIAVYPNPSVLFSADMDYYKEDDKNNMDVINFSVGTELFLNENNAIRLGYFTNYTNQKPVSTDTYGPHEFIDLQGATLGYSAYQGESSITFGAIAASGEGKAQIYTGQNATRDVARSSMTLIFAINHNY